MNLGNELQKAREEKGLSIEELQKKTKIRKKYLVALENNNFSEIKGEVYVKSFIKGYTRAVGINPDPFIYEYEQYIINKKSDTNNKNNENNNKSFYKYKSFKKIVIILLIIILLGTIGFLFFRNNESNTNQSVENNITEIENSLKKDINLNENDSNSIDVINNKEFKIAENDFLVEKDLKLEKNIIEFDSKKNNISAEKINYTSEKEQYIVSQNNKEKNPETNNKENSTVPEKINLKIVASEKSWLRVTLIDSEDNEKILFEGLMNSDDKEDITFNVNSSLKLRIGNGNGIYILNKDKQFGPWGERSEVLEKEIYFKEGLKIK